MEAIHHHHDQAIVQDHQVAEDILEAVQVAEADTAEAVLEDVDKFYKTIIS